MDGATGRGGRWSKMSRWNRSSVVEQSGRVEQDKSRKKPSVMQELRSSFTEKKISSGGVYIEHKSTCGLTVGGNQEASERETGRDESTTTTGRTERQLRQGVGGGGSASRDERALIWEGLDGRVRTAIRNRQGNTEQGKGK
ncbi:hypothetical protein Pcinc_035438 [Petrolisthes cinctipes]|uniref:Uncharacterized protein n=1 Tax=Petrolisthes cinctipes TaxID=88211 RepID=A0AAE1C0V2_PETCI|nr:hypothetical protein Pcinc_035438 [Petrolisthes cinctipes]